MKTTRIRIAGSLLAITMAFVTVRPSTAAAANRFQFDLPAEPLSAALIDVGKVASRQVLFSADDMTGLTTAALRGDLSPEEAIARLLRGKRFTIESTADAIYVHAVPDPQRTSTSENDAPSAIVVTGSRLRGVPIASPVIQLTRSEMEDAGDNSLPDALRQLPQNFGGGQTPAIGPGVPGASGQNLGSGTAINLRGLGQDATLTLLNGHRLAYNGPSQGVDISMFPLAAVERIDVIPDGASALYGSDAVAGVANIVLRRDFEGLQTQARYGTSTDSGDSQQQYSAVTGRVWGSGGFMIALDYEKDTTIRADQRSFTFDLYPTETLLPSITHQSLVASFHQSVLENLTFSVDGTINHRTDRSNYPYQNDQSYLFYGDLNHSSANGWNIAPALSLALPRTWTIQLNGVYGSDDTHYVSNEYYLGQIDFPSRGCYCNMEASAELEANGPVVNLPGGQAKLAVGGGYRSSGYHGYRTEGIPQNIDASQRIYYGFAELNIPLISQAQDVGLARRLSVSAAGRYENYVGLSTVFSPKLGLLYEVVPGLSIKGSWGKSFKAPQFFQQFATRYAAVFDASSVGGVGLPAGATAIIDTGGNVALKPERSTSWSSTIAMDPPGVTGLHVEATYFHIRYKDRVVAPITYETLALSDPAYRDLLVQPPTLQQVSQALVGRSVYYLEAGTFDPSSVVAIANGDNANVSSQNIHGVDVSANYKFTIYSSTVVRLTGSASYLSSKQALSDLAPVVMLAGTVFNPPHYRARAGFTLDRGGFDLTSFVNYTGEVKDARVSPEQEVGSLTTWDLAGRIKLPKLSPLLSGFEIALSVMNVLNNKPPRIYHNAYSLPYDSTNYSAVGRFASISLLKQW